MTAGATYQAIATATLASNAPSVTFSSISQVYTDLVLVVHSQFSAPSGFKLRFNSDAGSNYGLANLYGDGSTAVAGSQANITSIHNNLVFGDSTEANTYTPNTINIFNYSNSGAYKGLLWRYGSTTFANSNGDVGIVTGQWRDNSAITSIEISVHNAVVFIAGCTFSLYGIARA